MAFLEASAKNDGAAIRAVMSSWPTKQRHTSPEQLTTGACICMGFPTPAPLPFVGNRIGSTNRRVDPHGHQLASATFNGDGWRKRHVRSGAGRIQDTLAIGLKVCHVDAKSEMLNLFLPYCPVRRGAVPSSGMSCTPGVGMPTAFKQLLYSKIGENRQKRKGRDHPSPSTLNPGTR